MWDVGKFLQPMKSSSKESNPNLNGPFTVPSRLSVLQETYYKGMKILLYLGKHKLFL